MRWYSPERCAGMLACAYAAAAAATNIDESAIRSRRRFRPAPSARGLAFALCRYGLEMGPAAIARASGYDRKTVAHAVDQTAFAAARSSRLVQKVRRAMKRAGVETADPLPGLAARRASIIARDRAPLTLRANSLTHENAGR